MLPMSSIDTARVQVALSACPKNEEDEKDSQEYIDHKGNDNPRRNYFL